MNIYIYTYLLDYHSTSNKLLHTLYLENNKHETNMEFLTHFSFFLCKSQHKSWLELFVILMKRFAIFCSFLFQFSSRYLSNWPQAAKINPRKGGLGMRGRDLNSGWYCTPI